jgi:hypothetical protein
VSVSLVVFGLVVLLGKSSWTFSDVRAAIGATSFIVGTIAVLVWGVVSLRPQGWVALGFVLFTALISLAIVGGNDSGG